MAPTVSPSQAPTISPSQTPTKYFSPTPIPTPVTVIPISQDPIAQHELVVINPGDYAVLRLKFYDTTTTQFQFQILSLPTSGSLYQLSQVYSKYGYEPKKGIAINQVPTNITGSKHRLYYGRPHVDYATNQKWDSFSYMVIRKDGATSYPATMTLVPPSGAIVGSDFLLGNENWQIIGNKLASTNAKFEPYSRGALMNYYIMGNDDLINVASSSSPDKDLWYFQAPDKFLGNVGIAYGGTLSFSLAAFSGDFQTLNDLKANVVILECSTCDGPVGKGITLGYNMATLFQSRNGRFTGQSQRITINLDENGGWLKDPQNTLLPWTKPSQCDIIQVLSRLSNLQILGDWTTWYETVSLDDVQFANTQGKLPLCAMSVPDASICTC
eukprot:gene3028-3303_t